MFKLLVLAIHLLSIAAVPMQSSENGSGKHFGINNSSNWAVNDYWGHLTSLSDRLLSDRWLQQSIECATSRSKVSSKSDSAIQNSNLPVIQEKKTLELENQSLDHSFEIKNSNMDELMLESKINEKFESPMNDDTEECLQSRKNSEQKENIQPVEKPFIEIKNSKPKQKDMNEKPELSNPYSILHQENGKMESLDLQYFDISQSRQKKPKIKVQSEDAILKEAALKKEEMEDEIEEFWHIQQVFAISNLTSLAKKVNDGAPSILTELKNLNELQILEPLLLEANFTVFDLILAAENMDYLLQLEEALSGSVLSKATLHFLLWSYMQNPEFVSNNFFTKIGLFFCEIRQELVSKTPIVDDERIHKKESKKSTYLRTLQFVQNVKNGKIDTFNDPNTKHKWDHLLILDKSEQYGKLYDILSIIASKSRLSYLEIVDYLVQRSKSPQKIFDIELLLTKQNFLGFMDNRPEIATWTLDDFEELANIFSIPFNGMKDVLVQRFFVAVWSFNFSTSSMKLFVDVYEKDFADSIPFLVYLYHIVLSPNSLVNAIRIVHVLPYTLKWERIKELETATRYLSHVAMPWQHKIKLEAIRWLIFDILLENQKVSKEIIAKCEEINQLVDGKGHNCKIKASVQSWLIYYDDDRQKSILKKLIKRNMQLTQLLADVEPSDKKQRYRIKKIIL